MRNFIVLLIILAMGYFAFQALNNTDAVRTEPVNERVVRENNLEDITGDDIPKGSHEAILEVKGETDTVIDAIEAKIEQWRIEVKAYIDANF